MGSVKILSMEPIPDEIGNITIGAEFMKGLSINELKIIPYLDHAAVGGRVVHLMPYWDGSEWHMWLDIGDKLLKIKIVDVIQMQYVAITPKDKNDLCIPFVAIMWQNGTFHENQKQLSALIDSFHAFGASLGKIRHFHAHRDQLGSKAHKFVETEIEYMVMNSRRIFDLLHESIAQLWNTSVKLSDPEHEKIRKSAKLPKSFADMVLKGDDFRDEKYLFQKFAMPETVGKVYVTYAVFFKFIRDYRTMIIHGFGANDHIFTTEKGFCIAKDSRAFRELKLWNNLEDYNSNVVSLKPFLAYLVWNTVSACNALAENFSKVIQMQPALVPGYEIFFRSPHNDEFIDIMDCVQNAKIWWD